LKCILVTGASGFIGKSTCETLMSKGFQVVGAVRNPEKASTIPAGCKRIAVGEIGPQTFWGHALKGVDAVVHTAAIVHNIKNDAQGTMLPFYRIVNTYGTYNLAQQAAAAGVRRLIYLSSIKVNGETTESGRPFTGEDKPEPVDAYGISKLEAEKGLLHLADETGLEVVIIRPPLVYGPAVKANFLNLMKLVDTGIPLPLASIDNRRSFIFLGNIVDAIGNCIDHPNAAGKTYLLSDGEDLSIPGLIRRLAMAMGKPARLFPVSCNILFRMAKLSGRLNSLLKVIGSLTVDGSLIRKDLGWKPSFTVEDGIKETVSWYLRRAKK